MSNSRPEGLPAYDTRIAALRETQRLLGSAAHICAAALAVTSTLAVLVESRQATVTDLIPCAVASGFLLGARAIRLVSERHEERIFNEGIQSMLEKNSKEK